MKLAVDAIGKMEIGNLKDKGSWKLAWGTLFQAVERGESCGFWRGSEGFFIDL